MSTDARGKLIVRLAKELDKNAFFYLCPTPESHNRTFLRANCAEGEVIQGSSLEDLFGWSVPIAETCARKLLGETLVDDLILVRVLNRTENLVTSSIRFSNLYLSSFVNRITGNLYVHSAYPTTAKDAVFFGPDTYLFVEFILDAHMRTRKEAQRNVRCAVDVACGAGAGAIALQTLTGKRPVETIGLDLNPMALRMAAINATIHDADIKFHHSDLFSAIAHRKDIDLIVSNPPYIASSNKTPLYSAGGAMSGLSLSLRIVEESLQLLATEGILLLYTGVPISVERPSHDPLLSKLQSLEAIEIESYKVIQPDMFGEELSNPAYNKIARIQTVGAVVRKISTI